MKQLIATVFLATLGMAAEAPKPTSAEPTKPTTVVLDAEQSRLRQSLDMQAAILNAQFDQLRKDTCWANGLKPEECGPWLNTTTILRVVKPEAKPAEAPVKPTETK